MANLSEEERLRRAVARARREALENEERKEERVREGTCLTWDEYVAGVPCRGCEQLIRGGGCDCLYKGLLHMTPEETGGVSFGGAASAAAVERCVRHRPRHFEVAGGLHHRGPPYRLPVVTESESRLSG